MKIQVGVMSEDANGAPDVTFHTIECSQEQYDNGDHYDMAKDLAEEDGYEPKIAFDERDPAWRVIKGNDIYKSLYMNVLNTCQNTFVGDNEVSGADMVSEVGEMLRRHVNVDLPAAGEDVRFYFTLGPDGYSGNAQDLSDVYLQTDPEKLADLAPATVVGLTLAQIEQFLESGRSEIGDLKDCASDALERSKKYGFTISETNAAEVMREEMRPMSATGPCLPTELDPALAAIMLDVAETQSNQARDLG